MARYDDPSDRYDHYRQHASRTTLYVGRIPRNTRKEDLEDIFGRYGRLQQVSLTRGDYGFVEFCDPQDADDARHHLDRRDYKGSHIIVQFAREHKKRPYDPYGQHVSTTQLFFCNIAHRTRQDDIENLFSKYGGVRTVILKSTYGFVDYYDHQTADGARRALDGQKYHGRRIVVEFARVADWWRQDHLQRNCPNSSMDFRRGRRYSRSPSPRHGRDRSWNYRRSRSRSYRRSSSRSYRRSRSRSYRQLQSPRRGNHDAGGEEEESTPRNLSPGTAGRRPTRSLPPRDQS